MRHDSGLETLCSFLTWLVLQRARLGESRNRKVCGWLFLLCFLWYYEETYQTASPVEPLTTSVAFLQHLLETPESPELSFWMKHLQFSHLPHNKSSSVGLHVTPALGRAPVRREPVLPTFVFFFIPANHAACLCLKFVVFAVGHSVSYQKPHWAWRGILLT